MMSLILKWVCGAHGLVILGLIISTTFQSCSLRKKKPEPLTIEIAMVNPAEFESQIPQMQEVQELPAEQSTPEPPPPAPTPEPTPAPIPEPRKETPKPVKKVETPKPKPVVKKTPPKPAPKKWTPKPVVRQDTRVRNPNTPVRRQTPTVKRQTNVRQSLSGAMPKSVTTTASNALPAHCGQIIQSRMFAAWQQPKIATYQSKGALIKIRIEKNGMISSATLARSSGNSAIDSTAIQAARSVRLPELTPYIKTNYIEVTIEFMLEG